MGNHLIVILGLFFSASLFGAEQPKRMGNSRQFDWPGEDGGYNIRETSDGGYIIAGNTADLGGNRDFLVLKLNRNLEPDSNFGIEGRVQIGSSGEDQAADILEIRDKTGRPNGFLVVGQSDTADGDFTGQRHCGSIDTVLVRLTPKGQIDPQFGINGTGIRFYGTSEDDEPIVHRHNYSEPGERLVQTDDGFIVASHARGTDGVLKGIAINGVPSGRDVFIFKIDGSGDFVEYWGDKGRFLLGTNAGSQDRQRDGANDFIFSIQLHPDGGLIAGGYTLGKDILLRNTLVPTIGNNDGQGTENASGDTRLYKMDGMVIRLTSIGELDASWGNKGVVFLGGTRQEKMYDVAIDDLGRYLVTGRTTSYDLQMERPSDNGDGFDLLLTRLLPNGTLDRSFASNGKLILPGPGDDQALRVEVLKDGTIVLLGQSTTTTGVFALPGNPHLFRQGLILLINESGHVEKLYSLGREGEDKPSSMVVNPDGRVAVTGFRIPSVDYEYDKEAKEISMRQLWVETIELWGHDKSGRYDWDD